jgi:anti-sigma factor RsiW
MSGNAEATPIYKQTDEPEFWPYCARLSWDEHRDEKLAAIAKNRDAYHSAFECVVAPEINQANLKAMREEEDKGNQAKPLYRRVLGVIAAEFGA